MTPEEIARVKESYIAIAQNKQAAADLFYDRLVPLAPQLRALTAGEMHEHQVMAMEALGLLVRSLHNVDGMVEILADYGRRLSHHGVTAADYDRFGDAMVRTLKDDLGLDQDGVLEAWTAAIHEIAAYMIDAADETPVAA